MCAGLHACCRGSCGDPERRTRPTPRSHPPSHVCPPCAGGARGHVRLPHCLCMLPGHHRRCLEGGSVGAGGPGTHTGACGAAACLAGRRHELRCRPPHPSCAQACAARCCGWRWRAMRCPRCPLASRWRWLSTSSAGAVQGVICVCVCARSSGLACVLGPAAGLTRLAARSAGRLSHPARTPPTTPLLHQVCDGAGHPSHGAGDGVLLTPTQPSGGGRTLRARQASSVPGSARVPTRLPPAPPPLPACVLFRMSASVCYTRAAL